MKNFDFFEVKGDEGWVKGLSEFDLSVYIIKIAHGLEGLNRVLQIFDSPCENG
ncbi:hypothetical protein [Flavobacterium lacus]|uniref:hypothetical protein n=1 Tax=Flavobacterium lacus TaxID=1353778 RepID=UPI0015ECA207|nr:hypothetical protein [Flavobacterium lacus]